MTKKRRICLHSEPRTGHPRKHAPTWYYWPRRTVVALLVGCVAATTQAQITVSGSYSTTDESYWTGGGGTKNGTIGGDTDGWLTVEGDSVLKLKRAYFGSGSSGGTAYVTLTGGGELELSDAFYLGNNTGTGYLDILAGGKLYTPVLSYIGNGSSAVGEMTISGSDSLWEADGTVYVGYGGEGTLTLAALGGFDGVDLQIGANSGSGTLNVLGSGATAHSTLTLSGNLTIASGSSGLVSDGGFIDSSGNISVTGSLTLEGVGSEIDAVAVSISSSDGAANATIRDGAAVMVSSFNVGTADSASGSATISGDETTVTTSTFVVGTGRVEVLDGAAVTATATDVNAVIVGFESTEVGHLLVSGSGAELTSANRINIGANGTGTLDIEAGGVVNGVFGYIGLYEGGDATVTVTGEGSQLNIAEYDSEGNITRGSLSIGDHGTGRLYIEDGAVVNSADGYLADSSTGSATVEISDSGSQWNVNSDLKIGSYGTASLLLENGGYLQSDWASLGENEGAAGYVTVTGAGTEWSNGTLYIGRSGTGTFTVADGALVDGSRNAFLGRYQTGYGTATVTGADSEWRQAGILYVGVGQNGGTGILNVENGGMVTSGVGYLGYYSGSSGTVNVLGTGSKWRVSGDLYVGVSGAGNLSVSDGGSVTVDGMFDQSVDGSTIVDGGTLSFSHFRSDTASLGTISLSDPTGSSALTVGADDGVTSTFAGVIQDYSSGPGSIVKTGSNTVILSGTNTYSGTTTINAGEIVLGNALALQNSTVVLNTSNGLDLNGHDATLGGLSGSGNLALGAQTISVGSNDESSTYSGILSGTGGLAKQGTGTLTLEGANTYSGGTTINAGTLSAASDDALGSGTITLDGGTLALTASTTLSPDLTVNSGGGTLTATDPLSLSGNLSVDGTLTASNGLLLSGLVEGDGTFAGAVTVSGTLAPGHSPGTMSFTDIILTSDTIIQIELAGYTQGTDYDFLNISGTATLAGTLELSFLNDFAPSVGSTFTVASWTSHTGDFTSISGTYPDGYSFSATYGDTSLTLTTLTAAASAVPEPGTTAAILGAFTLATVIWRRRRQRA